jgi:hypothetical protein
MSQRQKIVYRTHKWEVTAPSQEQVINISLDQKVASITGVRINSPLSERATIGLTVSGEEIFDRDFPARILDFSNSATQRFFEDFFLGTDGRKAAIDPGNYAIVVQHKDVEPPSGSPPFVPHLVQIVFRCLYK